MKNNVIMKPNWDVSAKSYCKEENIIGIIVFNYPWNEIEFHLIPYTETSKRNNDGTCIGTWHIKTKQS